MVGVSIVVATLLALALSVLLAIVLLAALMRLLGGWRLPRNDSDVQNRLQVASNLVTVFAAAVAMVALAWGFVTFRQANRLQDEAAATAALQSYVELRVTQPKVDYYGAKPAKKGWIGLDAFATAEIIYLGMEGDEGWEQTAADIIKDNEGFVLAPGWGRKSGSDAITTIPSS
jgi:hypothetical protein